MNLFVDQWKPPNARRTQTSHDQPIHQSNPKHSSLAAFALLLYFCPSPIPCAIFPHFRSTSNFKIATFPTRAFQGIAGLNNMAANGEIKNTNGTERASHNHSILPRDDRRSAAPGILSANVAQAPWTVEAVVAGIPGGPPETGSSSPVPFFHMLERLKTTKREGWRRFGIAQYLSSSHHPSHMFANWMIS